MLPSQCVHVCVHIALADVLRLRVLHRTPGTMLLGLVKMQRCVAFVALCHCHTVLLCAAFGHHPLAQ